VGFTTINGYPLRFRIEGDGPLVVFGHGLMGNIEQIDDNAGPLSRLLERVRVLVYDARGHGQSGGPEDESGYTWETLGCDMSALIEFAREDSAIIGGASMGAATALWVAIERPVRVRALALMIPPPLGPRELWGDAERQAIQTLDLIGAAVQNFGVEKTVELAQNFPGFATTPDEAQQRAQWLLGQNPLTLRYAIRGLVAAPGHDPEAYRGIKVPTLVLAHEGDGLHPVRSAQLLKDAIADCRLVVAPDPNYWQTHPDELHAEFETFLDRIL
jgi:3-oxoadipate enol-lactonase